MRHRHICNFKEMWNLYTVFSFNFVYSRTRLYNGRASMGFERSWYPPSPNLRKYSKIFSEICSSSHKNKLKIIVPLQAQNFAWQACRNSSWCYGIQWLILKHTDSLVLYTTGLIRIPVTNKLREGKIRGMVATMQFRIFCLPASV
jgi:hypothetical protein